MFRLVTILAIGLLSSGYCDTNYRLNTPIRPSSYSILITPFFDTKDSKAFTFDAEVNIAFTTENFTSVIKLHSEGLEFDAANITLTTENGNIIVLDTTEPLIFDKKYTFAYINLGSELQVGVNYLLKIEYTGPIREDLKGFYRNYYYENGVKKWLGATQMEPTHARKVFPCFDEPDLKSKFTISIIRPGNFEPSLANTVMQNYVVLPDGVNVLETFYPTPKMSTYLVAFLVSEFKVAASTTIDSRGFGVYTRPEASNQSQYTLEVGTKVVEALGEYFGIDYYSTDVNLKLDHVALPDFSAGAMENWGLIKYREALLLYVPEVSTPYYKYRVAQIMAHETAHMWFGDLVTCHWWSNTWLNEGFANYFQDYITALVEPSVGSATELVTGSVYSAYDADESAQSPPISNPNVNSPAEISAHFGTVTYQKAGSVIRMMHHLLGDDAFKFGLNHYLTTNKYSSGYPDLLYAGLEEGVTSSDALASYPGFNITGIMSSWITQAGHPVVTVDIDYSSETVKLTQKRFYTDGSQGTSELYKIPITFTTELNPDFNNTRPTFIMDNETYSFVVANISDSHPWILINVQETGLYRVNYDRHSWSIISNTLKGEKRVSIHHLNRAKIVNDLFAFYFADQETFELLHDVLQFLKQETDYSVWVAALRNKLKLRNKYLGNSVLKEIDSYFLDLLEPIVDNLGYTVGSDEDFGTLRNRMQILEFACKIGHEGCLDKTAELFKGLRQNGTEISPSLRPVSYCSGLRRGDEEDYDFLWQRMKTTNVANEARIIGDALACTSSEDRLKSFLVSMLEQDSPIRIQDLTVPLSGVLSNYNNVHLALEGLKQNLTLWNTIYGSLDSVLVSIASALHTTEQFTEFESILSSCTQCSNEELTSARSALTLARKSSQWAEDHKADLLKLLNNAAIVNVPKIFLIITTILLATFNI